MCQASKEKGKEELLSVAQEIAFAKALAANEKSLRNRALKKLRKWLTQKSQQDSPGLRFTEDGFMRIWKGLFYCVWMSDKPLVQEEVVERVCNLIHCFTHLEDAEKFVCCFFQSISQSWLNLDGHRIDKYYMLVRRFLGQIFEYMFQQNWNRECVVALCGVLHKGFLNAPIGLNLHIAEVYLEELAKTGRADCSGWEVLQVIKPFAEAMAVSNDSRLLKYGVNYIFLNLLRQTEEAFKHAEKFEVWKEMGYPDGDIDVLQEMSEDEVDSDLSMDEDGDEDDEISMDSESAKYPRAGNVDVVLPPLDFDTKEVRDFLVELQRRKDTTTKARKILNLVIKKYDKLLEGKYPLGIHKVEIPEVENEEEIIEKTAEELAREDRDFAMERKRYKKGSKGAEASAAVWEVSPLKETNSLEPKAVSNIGNWQVSTASKRKSQSEDSICASMKRIKITMDESVESDSLSEEHQDPSSSSQSSESTLEDTNSVPKKQNRKRRKKGKTLPNETGNENENPQVDQEEIMKMYKLFVMDEVKRQRQKRKKIEQAKMEWGINNEEEVVIPFNPDSPSTSGSAATPVSKSGEISVPTSDNVPTKKKAPNSGKKVAFVLNRNTAQCEMEYKKSLIKSPNIPYDAEKKPLQGVLKPSAIGSPINPFFVNTTDF